MWVPNVGQKAHWVAHPGGDGAPFEWLLIEWIGDKLYCGTDNRGVKHAVGIWPGKAAQGHWEEWNEQRVWTVTTELRRPELGDIYIAKSGSSSIPFRCDTYIRGSAAKVNVITSIERYP